MKRKATFLNLALAGTLGFAAAAYAFVSIDIWTDYDADQYHYVDREFNGEETVVVMPRYSSRTEDITLYVDHTYQDGSSTETDSYVVEAFASDAELPIEGLNVGNRRTRALAGTLTVTRGDKEVTTSGNQGSLTGEFVGVSDTERLDGELSAEAIPAR